MDEVSLAALRRREPAAIAAFRAWALPKVTSASQRLLGDRALAEEVGEDVCGDFLMDYLDVVQSAAAVPSYLQVMTVRRSFRLRRQARARAALTSSAAVEPSGEDSGREAEVRLDARGLARCMEGLTPASQRILRLRFGGEKTQEEIGTVMGVSKQYVGRVIQKSLEALKRCLEAAP